jgi:hypothetical protein
MITSPLDVECWMLNVERSSPVLPRARMPKDGLAPTSMAGRASNRFAGLCDPLAGLFFNRGEV